MNNIHKKILGFIIIIIIIIIIIVEEGVFYLTSAWL
jgi:hypothetical protein